LSLNQMSRKVTSVHTGRGSALNAAAAVSETVVILVGMNGSKISCT
jgi:hypothetical protein